MPFGIALLDVGLCIRSKLERKSFCVLQHISGLAAVRIAKDAYSPLGKLLHTTEFSPQDCIMYTMIS